MRTQTTELQLKLLKFVRTYWSRNHRAPAYEEIAREIGVYNHRSVMRMVRSLEAFGLLTRTKGKYRSLALTPEGERAIGQPIRRLTRPASPTQPTAPAIPVFNHALYRPRHDIDVSGSTNITTSS